MAHRGHRGVDAVYTYDIYFFRLCAFFPPKSKHEPGKILAFLLIKETIPLLQTIIGGKKKGNNFNFK